MTETFDPDAHRRASLEEGSGVSPFLSQARTDNSTHFTGTKETGLRGPGDLLAPTGSADVSGREMTRRHDILDRVPAPPEQPSLPRMGYLIAKAALHEAHNPIQAIEDAVNTEFDALDGSLDPDRHEAARQRAINARIRAYNDRHAD